MRMIRRADTARPRSVQTSVGPSQLGVECEGSLAYQHLAPRDIPSASAGDPLPAIVGTAVHAWLEEAARLDDAVNRHSGEPERWLTERRLTISHAGVTVGGTCDLYDLATGTVIDWKVVGPTAARNASHDGPPRLYRTQSQLYGLGYRQAGYPVRAVAIAMLPRNGPLRSMQFFAEEYDERVAHAAMERLARVDGMSDWRDAEFQPSEDNCRWCPVPFSLCQEGLLFR
jgi:hypothetical protein